MFKSVLVTVFMFSCVYAANTDAFLDWVVDAIIDNIREDMIKNNVSTAPVPDFTKSFTEKFMGVEFEADLTAKNGLLSDITTVQRRSKASIEQRAEDNVVTITSELGLNDMKVTYTDFTAKAWGTKTTGVMSAKCTTDSFTLSITTSEDAYGTCTTTLNYANLTTLGSCSVTVGDGGFSNWLRGYLFTFLLNHYESEIANVVNGQIGSVVKENIEKQDLCKFLKQGHILSKNK